MKDTKPLVISLKTKIKQKDFFRSILYTTKNIQMGFMCLEPDEDIDTETHKTTDQIFLVVYGRGYVQLSSSKKMIEAGDLILIPPKIKHNIKNTGKGIMRLVTIYSPPQHLPETIHKTKEDAEEDKNDLSFGHNR